MPTIKEPTLGRPPGKQKQVQIVPLFRSECVIVPGSAGTVQVIYSPVPWASTLQKCENRKEFAS